MSTSTSQSTPEDDNLDRTADPAGAEITATTAAGPEHGGSAGVRCETCGALVEAQQRYCVECGTHRVGVNDPAASFMNRPAVRPARAGRAVVVSSRRSRLLTALMLALIPVAVGVGVLIGRSSNNRDTPLLNAIRHERTQIVKVQSGSAQVITVSGSGAATKGAAKSHQSTTAAAVAKKSQAVGSKETKAQQQQSAATVKKLNNSTGSSYLTPITSQVGGG